MKRLFVLLLAVSLVAGALVFPASATATEGTYGNNLKWRFEEDPGTFTISGTGTATKLPSTVITPHYAESVSSCDCGRHYCH